MLRTLQWHDACSCASGSGMILAAVASNDSAVGLPVVVSEDKESRLVTCEGQHHLTAPRCQALWTAVMPSLTLQ